MLHFSKDRGKLSLSFTSKKFLAEAIEKLDDENNTKKTFTLEYSSSCVQYPRCKMNILSKIILCCNSRYVYRSISYLFFCDICPFLIAFRFLFSISTWLFPTTSSVFFTVKVRTIKKIEVQFLWNGERLSFCLHHCKMKQYLQPDIGNF